MISFLMQLSDEIYNILENTKLIDIAIIAVIINAY